MGLFDFHRADELISRGMTAVQRDLDELGREVSARRTTRVAYAHLH